MKECLNCTNYVISSQYKYCSPLCNTEHKKNHKIAEWLKEPSLGTALKGGLKSYIRNYLIVKAEGKCTRCSRSDIHPITGNYVLEVDHIDGDRFNNSPNNLVVLCLNCHSLTNTYRNNKRRNVR